MCTSYVFRCRSGRALSTRAMRGSTNSKRPPASEIVIGGEILAGVHEPEGPFGELTGYASYRCTQNVFVAELVRMRGDAIFQSVTSGMSKDHVLVSCITHEGEIFNALKRNLPNVRAVHVRTRPAAHSWHSFRAALKTPRLRPFRRKST